MLLFLGRPSWQEFIRLIPDKFLWVGLAKGGRGDGERGPGGLTLFGSEVSCIGSN